MRSRLGSVAVVAASLAASCDARADEAPAPYSVPWQLRPVVAPTGLRLDTSFARYEDAASRPGVTAVTVFTAAVRIEDTGPPTAGLALFARLAAVRDLSPAREVTDAFVNPLFGAAYAIKTDSGLRYNVFGGLTVPVGMGGGADPGHAPLEARLKGPNARAQYDNALFAVNDAALVPGVSLAYVKAGFTVQGEASLFYLVKTRDDAVSQPDTQKTNFTCGAHVGYFVAPSLSLSGELRYQRWIVPPIAVDRDPTRASMDTTTFAVGPRFHMKLGDTLWFRPGFAYQRALDLPLAGSTPNVHILQVDLPVFFI